MMVPSINKPFPVDSNILMFIDQNLEDVYSSHDDSLVIKVHISNAMVSRVLVDNRYEVNILFKDEA